MKKVVHYFQLHWWLLPLIAMLLLAAYLRLHDIRGYMTFLGDEGRDVLVVKRIIVDHKLTLLGPTASVGGFFLGPIYYYFMLPFLWAWQLDPVGPAIMVALFGIGAVYLVFKAGKEFFHPIVGLIAGSLFALSPVVIAYSRSSWNPNLVPFFSMLLMYLLWRVVDTKKTSYLIAIGVTLGIGLQLHYLFLFLFVVTFLWLLLQRKSIGLSRTIPLVFAGFLIGYAPFLAFEVRHGFPNTQSIFRFVLAGKDTGVASNFWTVLDDVLFRSFGRLVFRLPEGGAWGNIPPFTLAAWVLGTRLAVFLSIVTIFAYDLKTKIAKGKSAQFMRAVFLLTVWLSTVVILFGFYRKAIYDYYFGIMFPVPFLLVGLVLYFLWKQRILRILLFFIWAGLLWLNWQGRPFLYAPNNQVNQAKTIADAALSHTAGKPFNFALITEANSDHTYRYFFEIEDQTPVTIENTDVDPARTSVTDQLIVICELSDCKPLGHPLWEIAGFGRAEITGEWSVSFVKIFRLVHYTGN